MDTPKAPILASSMRRLHVNHFWLATAILWTTAVIYGSVMPSSTANSISLWGIPHGDKVLHIAGYAMMALLWLAAVKKLTIRLLASLVVLGIALEIAQGLLTMDRRFELWDIIANITGVFVGAAISRRRIKRT